jgi:hypothetical protein
MGLQIAKRQQETLMRNRRRKHFHIMKWRKWFGATFNVDIKQFYKDIFTGFDVIAFDDFLMSQDEQYRKANAGELGEDVDCSMATHLLTKYGEEAAERIQSFI